MNWSWTFLKVFSYCKHKHSDGSPSCCNRNKLVCQQSYCMWDIHIGHSLCQNWLMIIPILSCIDRTTFKSWSSFQAYLTLPVLFYETGVQRQKYGCSIGTSGWERRLQRNCPHCRYPSSGSPGVWYQEQVRNIPSTVCSLIKCGRPRDSINCPCRVYWDLDKDWDAHLYPGLWCLVCHVWLRFCM